MIENLLYVWTTTNMQLSKNTCHKKTFNNSYNKLSLGNLQYYVRTKQLKDITTNKGELDKANPSHENYNYKFTLRKHKTSMS
jgi:hypothetical protein